MPRGIERTHQALQRTDTAQHHIADRAHSKYQARRQSNQPKDTAEISPRAQRAHAAAQNANKHHMAHGIRDAQMNRNPRGERFHNLTPIGVNPNMNTEIGI
ncbi:MAG: hypothetical protein HQ591_13195 [candidate division Zixibacteria bacterium]|nr:hypothetical protein [Candidatus Tariuqbacter arcticus]